jgi:golgi apyrase
MRLLSENDREQILYETCDYISVNSPFQVPDCDLHIQVIPGETEGLYGWIAANYLLGGFNKPDEHDHGKGHHTYGFLDMGGASAQIAFAPNKTETTKHAEDLKLLRLRKLNGADTEYRVFVTTWLGFGANQARERYVDALVKSTDSDILELPDPCLPTGLKLTTAGKTMTTESTSSQYLLGTGDFPGCLRQTFPLLEKDKPCNDDPCLLGGVHVPAIDFDVNHFVGVSEYWHTTHEIFEMDHNDKAYDFHTYQSRVNDFCSQSWQDIASGIKSHKWGKKVDEIIAEEVCFKASWLINMLHDGIGIPRIGLESFSDGKNITDSLVKGAKSKGFLDPFQAVNKISGVEVSWTLGKIILYATSLVPPIDEPLPVGFGSNIPGIAIPIDWQRPSSIDALSAKDDASDWADTLFLESPRRVPGLLLFLLIICVAVYLLCGRDRRQAIFARVCRCCRPRRHRRGAAVAGVGAGSRLGKLFGFPAYERVNADADEAAANFEMPAYDSDESIDDVEAQASGWATPKLMVDGSLVRDGIIRADSRDSLVPPRLEARLNRSRSPAMRTKEAID